MKKPPFITPMPWRDALPLFPTHAREILAQCGHTFLRNQVEVFPCKNDGVNFNGQTYCSFLTLEHDPSEGESFTVSRQDFFPGGGADGDCCSFPTREEALQWANTEIQTDGYNLDEQDDDDTAITAIGDKVTVTERRLSLAELLDKAIASARASELDIRIALGEASSHVAYLPLYDLLEPIVKVGQRLTHLRSFVKDAEQTDMPAGFVPGEELGYDGQPRKPEATYPDMSVSDLVTKGVL